MIVAALRAMQAAGTLRDANITIVLTGDEERTGAPIAVARRDLIEAGRWRRRRARVRESRPREGGRDIGTVARRSSTSWTLTHARAHRPFEPGVFGEQPGLWRDLRDGAHPRRLPPRAARAQPHLQCRRDRRRHAGRASTPAASAPPRPARPTSSPRPRSPAATCGRLTPEQDARVRARMQAIVAQHLPRTPARSWSSPRTAIRRWRRPRAIAPCSPGSTWSTATSACPKWPN